MKRKALKFKFLAVCLMLVTGGALRAQTFERNRSLERSFALDDKQEIQIQNKYGDIHLVPWDKDSVRFEIELSVTSNKQSKIDKIFDYVDFEFKDSRYYVIAQTVFKGQNNFWTEISDLASTIFSSGTHTQIDYTVYFPANNDLKIENKFGNVYTTDQFGRLDLTLSNGDFQAHALEGPARIKLDFGNATIDRIDNGNLVTSYSEITIENTDNLITESRSSKIYLTSASSLQINSKRDKYYIKNVQDLGGDAFFSNLSIDNAGDRINLRTTYGDVKLQAVGAKFRLMDLSAENTDLTLYLDKQHYFLMNLTRDDRTQMVFTSTLLTKKESPLDEDAKTFKVECTAGNAEKPKVSLNLNTKGGKIYLMGS